MTVHLWSGVYRDTKFFNLTEEPRINHQKIHRVIEAYYDREVNGLYYNDETVSKWMLSLPGGLV